MLARVHVFRNGLAPEGPRGPLGFQPDVFDRPPGDGGYGPLRTIVLVACKEPSAARFSRAASGNDEAVRRGELTAAEPGVVVNMPMLTWPGGHR